MNYTTMLIIGTLTDFILTAGGVLTGGGVVGGKDALYTTPVLITAAIIGMMAAAKHLNGMLFDGTQRPTLVPTILKAWFILGVVAFSLQGCSTAQPISANPLQDLKPSLPTLSGPLSVEEGLKEAAFNFDGAMAVGITDPRITAAAMCVHGVMADLGLEVNQTPAPSFTPQTSTVLGKGSVLLIRAVQLDAAKGKGLALPMGCDAQIGLLVIDAARAGRQAFPGGGLLPGLR